MALRDMAALARPAGEVARQAERSSLVAANDGTGRQRGWAPAEVIR
jgi:hypothetical protein